MKRFFQFFAERHLLAMLITIMTVLLGVSSLMRIKRDVFPSVDFGEVFVTTLYPGAAPEDVELNVTNRIEEEIQEIRGIERYTSVSMENISVLDILSLCSAGTTKQSTSRSLSTLTASYLMRLTLGRSTGV